MDAPPPGPDHAAAAAGHVAAVAERVADDLEVQLAAATTPGRAAKERAYLKSELHHLGVAVPTVRRIVTAHVRVRPGLDHAEVVALADALWARPVHERRLAAVELLTLTTDRLSIADASWLRGLAADTATWALLDPLAIGAVGALVDLDDPEDPWADELRDWAQDPSLWLRRASLLAHLPGLRGGAETSTGSGSWRSRCWARGRRSFARRSGGCYGTPAASDRTSSPPGSCHGHPARPA